MIMNEWATIISSLGFPIAACCFLAWFISTTLKETVKEFRASIDANTKAVQEMIFLLKEGGVKIERCDEALRD